MRKVCPHCAKPYSPAVQGLQSLGLGTASGCTFMRGKGCHQCLNSGYKGRTAVFEILKIDEQIQNMITRKAASREIARAAVEAGKLRLLREDAVDKVCRGITTVEEALSVVMA
jgi:type IV pilus assembly protein PilB